MVDWWKAREMHDAKMKRGSFYSQSGKFASNCREIKRKNTCILDYGRKFVQCT
jgi:hypothetical protein